MLIDTNVIDFVSTSKNDKEVHLTISDEMDWKNESDHLTLLQKKINTYLAFIEGGQLYEDYPKAKDKQLIIQVGAKFKVPDIGKQFYDMVKENLEEAGYGFSYKVIMR